MVHSNSPSAQLCGMPVNRNVRRQTCNTPRMSLFDSVPTWNQTSKCPAFKSGAGVEEVDKFNLVSSSVVLMTCFHWLTIAKVGGVDLISRGVSKVFIQFLEGPMAGSSVWHPGCDWLRGIRMAFPIGTQGP